MTQLALMQPYLFPYIGYFQVMKAVDVYVVYDDVQFIKGGWINRNNILVQGKKMLFSFALEDASANKLINEITLSEDMVKFQRTLAQNYAKAPYRAQVCELIQRICSFPDKNLARFIRNSFKEINRYLEIDTPLVISSDLAKDTTLRAQDKVIAICQELSADCYINAIGGQELYDRESFNKHGIELKFLQTKQFSYKQFSDEFVPDLSIIDVLMFNSTQEVNELLDMYELV